MKCRFGWALPVAVGIALGSVAGVCEKTNAVAAPRAEQKAEESSVIGELREIKDQLKELNGMFRSGRAKVVVVINPGG
ncbi:MAG: hypothetical protein LLG00_02970 [Planctomycetaceae bacterium]|nr:hypothetical protein [Planctomycetaceae bacterium]